MSEHQLIQLSPLDLAISAFLVLLLAIMSWALHLDIGKRMLIAAGRSVIQLLLLGMVLKTLFNSQSLILIGGLSLLMLSVAGYEVMARQKRRLSGWWGYGTGALSMFLSSFVVTLLAIHIILQPAPWFSPQYLIPLLGMILGNTMTGIAIALDNLTRSAWDKKGEIEAQLMLGMTPNQAISDIRRESLRAGLIPIINTMTTAGLVSIPGMMTGQILGGTPPMEAAQYQLLIIFLIAAGTGLGSATAVIIGAKRLFDERHRLRLDRLQ